MSTLQVHPAGEDSRRSSNVEAPTVKKGHFTYKAKIRTVEMILAKFVVYSKNYWADFKLLYKNEHILFSCWTCHPNHPFSRGDRFQVLVLSLTLAFAFSSLLEGAGSDSLIPLTILTILVQQFYDAFAKAITGCLCVQSCPDGIVKCCEGLGKLALCIQAIFAGIMLIVALVILSNLGRSPTYAITVFLCQKIGSFVVITSVVVWWGFHSKRKRQMKPTREKLAEAFVKTKWESPIGSNFCIMCMTCCIMGRTKKPPCTKWNKFWGPDKAQEDLPLLAELRVERQVRLRFGGGVPSARRGRGSGSAETRHWQPTNRIAAEPSPARGPHPRSSTQRARPSPGREPGAPRARPGA